MSLSSQTVDAIIKELKSKVEGRRTREALPFTSRDAHADHHGIVPAEFIVRPDVPAHLRVGIFAEARRYRAYIRFSNAGGEPTDAKPDFRGMAIKVMGVAGTRALTSELPEDEATTQDFHLVNCPVFFVRSPEELLDFLMYRRKMRDARDAATSKVLNVARFKLLALQLWLKYPVVRRANAIRNPLTVAYFSQTPYALGNTLAVKYQARPHRLDVGPPSPEAKARPHYLREAMVSTLREGDVVFDFMVQCQTDPVVMPIDDPTQEWRSDFIPVATVTISATAGDFNNRAQMDFAEDISFSPWHSILEHQPLGAINEARKIVYRTMAKHRHDANGIRYREPSGVGDFRATRE